MMNSSWSHPVQLSFALSPNDARPFFCLNYGSGGTTLCCLDLGGLAQLGSQDEGDVLFPSSWGIHRSELPPSSYLSPVE